jgi:signal transduction histidine kinase
VFPTNLFSTSTFRLAVMYLLLFGLSVVAILGFVYWTTAGFIARQTDEAIESEIESLADTYRTRGLGAMQRLVERRAANQRQTLYIIATPDMKPFAGNLDLWPRVADMPSIANFGSHMLTLDLWPKVDANHNGWIEFTFERPLGDTMEVHAARARHLVTDGGFHVLVGRDVQEREIFAERLRESLVWTVGLVIALGLVGGMIMSRNMLARIDGINRVSRDIMLGDFSRRVPVAGNSDELDRLATNLNAMLDQIERLMTGMRQVTDNVAHDLRTPLNRLRSRLEVTLMEPASIESYRRALVGAVEEAEGLVNTFNALLSIAQAESGVKRDDMADLDVAAVTRDAAELYEPAAEDKGLVFNVEAKDGVNVRGDRHLLSQAIANLLENAIKYTPKGGQVTVVAQKAGDGAELVVADSGPGIEATDRDRVLDRFVRLEASRNSPGSGLGLSLVRAVARHHGAALKLDDNHPGLKVTLHFPTAKAA